MQNSRPHALRVAFEPRGVSDRTRCRTAMRALWREEAAGSPAVMPTHQQVELKAARAAVLGSLVAHPLGVLRNSVSGREEGGGRTGAYVRIMPRTSHYATHFSLCHALGEPHTFGPVFDTFFLGFTVGGRHVCVIECRTSRIRSRAE